MRQLFSGSNPELVLFDLDGTLVDSVPDLAQAVDRMLSALGKPEAGVDKVRTWVGNGAAVLVERAISDEMYPSDIDQGEFEKAYALFLDYYAQATADQSVLYPGVEQCLQSLQQQSIRMGVVTNKPIRFTDTMLEGFGLSGYFDVVLGGDSLPQKKPEPEPLLEAMKRCDVEPESTLMVGDSKSDVGAARAAGCPVVCVPYGYNHGQDIADSNPDLIVESLSDLT